MAGRLVVLDHHVSARDRYLSHPEAENRVRENGHEVHFDLDHSGAILSWNYFHPGVPAPDLLRYVEDQDLWNWKLPHSEEVNAAIASYPHDFRVWDQLASRPIEELVEEGAPIVRSNKMEIERALGGAHTVTLGNERIEAVNARFQRAPIGHELAKRAVFGKAWGLVYRTQGRRVDATIYSIGDLDVSRVAESFGGGGHRNASGFSLDLDRWLEEFALD
jgi:oligoribonuclease NrnB/cAMP/cGMP phosphodiesterase (DHH superfamily)